MVLKIFVLFCGLWMALFVHSKLRGNLPVVALQQHQNGLIMSPWCSGMKKRALHANPSQMFWLGLLDTPRARFGLSAHAIFNFLWLPCLGPAQDHRTQTGFTVVVAVAQSKEWRMVTVPRYNVFAQIR